MEKKAKIYLVKPVSENDFKPSLNASRLIENSNSGIETSILLDTNIMRHLEKVVERGNTKRAMKEFDLLKLVLLLNTQQTQISVSAGTGMEEMPPARRRYSQYCYNEFLRVHAPNMLDDPRGIHETPPESSLEEWGFEHFNDEQKRFFSFYYCSYLLMLIANRQPLKPEEKFKYYLKRIVEDIDVISAPISEIAKLSFYSPSSNDSVDFKKFVRATKDNFLEVPRKAFGRKLSKLEGFKHSAFNSSVDLFLLTVATQSDANGLDGTAQDTWIATSDGKLAKFIEYFRYAPTGKNTGMWSEIYRYEEQKEQPYWNEVDEINARILNSRRDKFFKDDIDIEKITQAVSALHEEIHNNYT